ncbi:MAG: DUF192 domain-containing protein [Fimbriimonadaceae bacterium]|nr:DUF192 domain-containing protein [Fimbriimonadaceae bacterium]
MLASCLWLATFQNPNRLYQLSDLKRVTVMFGSRAIPSYLCDTDPKRQEGMMFLTAKEFKTSEGFLFHFPDEAPRGFWMRNTVLPLDIIYIKRNGLVTNVGQGKPFSERTIPSAEPATYVLELRQGMAKKFGIKAGSRIKIPKLPPAQ